MIRTKKLFLSISSFFVRKFVLFYNILIFLTKFKQVFIVYCLKIIGFVSLIFNLILVEYRDDNNLIQLILLSKTKIKSK